MFAYRDSVLSSSWLARHNVSRGGLREHPKPHRDTTNGETLCVQDALTLPFSGVPGRRSGVYTLRITPVRNTSVRAYVGRSGSL